MPAIITSAISLKPGLVGQSLEDRPATPWRAPNWPPSLRSHAARRLDGNDLLDAVTAGPSDRVLVIGVSAADTLCDAMRRGSAFCAPPAYPDPAKVVVALAIRTEEAGQAVVDCAHRALPAGGRIALRAMGQGAAELAGQIADRLRIYGFERVRMRGQAEGALVSYCLCGGSKVGAVGDLALPPPARLDQLDRLPFKFLLNRLSCVMEFLLPDKVTSTSPEHVHQAPPPPQRRVSRTNTFSPSRRVGASAGRRPQVTAVVPWLRRISAGSSG